MRATLVHYRRRFRRPATRIDSDEIHRALATLTGMLPEEGWELAGGVALDATMGSFRRVHGDFDLHVDGEALPALVDAMRPHGYSLQTRHFWARVSPARVVVCTSELDARKTRPQRLRRLMLVRTAAGEVERLLTSLDVMLYVRKGDQYIRHDGKLLIPEPWWRWGTFTTECGATVRLAHPRHLLAVKQRRRLPTDREDRMLLEAWLDRHPEVV